MTMANTDDHPPTSPAESLRLIAQERATAAKELAPDVRLLNWPWGIAWLVGFGLLFLRFGPDGRVFVPMPDWLPLIVLFALLTAAGVITATVSVRSGRQVAGRSSVQGLLYGLSWPIAFGTTFTIAVRFTDDLPAADEVVLLWAALATAITGVLYLAAGAMWSSRSMYVMGVWLLAINAAGVIIGPGWHSLFLAVLGGGALILGGALSWAAVNRQAA
jgi:hypothetical protein